MKYQFPKLRQNATEITIIKCKPFTYDVNTEKDYSEEAPCELTVSCIFLKSPDKI